MPKTPITLTEKTREFLRNQYRYSQVIKDPKSTVDLYDTYHRLWSTLQNNGSYKYADPFLLRVVSENKKILDYTSNISALGALGYKPLGTISPLIGIMSTYSNELGEDKLELGKKIIKEDKESNIYRMLEEIPLLYQAMGEVIVKKNGIVGTTNFVNAAIANIALLDKFEAKLDKPTTDEELLLKAPANSLKQILGEVFGEAKNRAENEGKDKYEEILEEELKKQGERIDILNERLSNYFDEILNEDLKKKKAEEVAFSMNEARGWGSVIGMLVGIENQKLGNAISNGTNAIIDSYEAFSMMSNLGFTAMSFATGVGGVLAVVSIINSFSAEDAEQSQMQALFDGLNKINENINKLRDEVAIIGNNTVMIIDQVNQLITFTTNNFGIISNKIDFLIIKIEEYNKLQLESEFQQKLIDIRASANKFKSKPTIHDFIIELNYLYNNSINEASNIKFTREKTSINENYEFLSLYSKVAYDSFRWSPLEYRPFLIEKLRNDFLNYAVDLKDSQFWKKHLNTLEDELLTNNDIEDIKFVNPIITSYGFSAYFEIIESHFSHFCSEENNPLNQVILERLNHFYSIFSWFKKTTFLLGCEIVLKYSLERYLTDAFQLLLAINSNRVKKINKFTDIDKGISKIQLDSFLLNPISSKLDLDYLETSFNESENYFNNFFAFSINNPIEFVLKEELLNPPFTAGVEIQNPNKIKRLNLHFEELMESLPNEIDNFIYLMSYYVKIGVLKVEKEYYIGKDRIDPNFNYLKPSIYGDFTIKYNISVDEKNPNLNALDINIEITIADNRLGLNALFNYNGPAFKGSTYNFSNLMGNGSITIWHENDNYIPTFPSSPFSDDFFNLLDKIFLPVNIISFKDSLNKLKELGVYIGIKSESNFKDALKFDSKIIDALFEKTRESWINLSTAILCQSESSNDTSIYFEFLERKPKLLDTSISLLDPESIDYAIGENFSDLLLLWINEPKGKDGVRKPFAGINIRGGLGEYSDLIDENSLPTILLRFSAENKERAEMYELHKPQKERILKNINFPQNPAFYNFIIPYTNEGFEILKKLYFRLKMRV